MIKPIYFYKIALSLLLFLCASVTHAQLTVMPSSTSRLLASKLAGPGITIVSDTLICNTNGNGTFVSTSTPITLDSGILLCTGYASAASGAESGATNGRFGGAGDADITPLLGTTTVSKDACALIIHLIPGGDTLSFNYQFGSEEYINSACGPYNDAFAFYISGPGVSTSLPGVNMALVPGTNIPVTINTINSGTPGRYGTLSTCTAMGAGSPFPAYYIDNTGGTAISYRGYTTKLTAKHWVRPCDTYRLKMVIGDASNDQYDSGVFIEAGSLKTNSFKFDASLIARTILGQANSIVKGCPGDSVFIRSVHPVTTNTVVKVTYAGSAVRNSDYTTSDSVVFNTGDSVVGFPITGLALSATGSQNIKIYINSFSVCGVQYTGIADSVQLNLLDKPAISIVNNDTTLCNGQTLQLNVAGTAGLTYNWSRDTLLDNHLIANPVATVMTGITYTVTATLPGSLCPTYSDTVRLQSMLPVASIVTPDTTVCEETQFTLRVAGSDTLYYSWSPATGLNNPSAKEPLLTATTTNNYVLTATIARTTCAVTANVNVIVIPKFELKTVDTTVCEGNNLVLPATVVPALSTLTYAWTGPNSYSSNLLNPVITTSTQLNKGTYYLVVNNMGYCEQKGTSFVTVNPTPEATIKSPQISYCQYGPSTPVEIPGYSNVLWYSAPNDLTPSLFAPYPNTDSIGILRYYAAQISLVSNCLSKMVEVDVEVKSCCKGTLYVPTAFTPNNDGKNDVLRVVKSSDYVINEFSIFNRWGIQVFDASGDKKAWDGTLNGEPADMGVYFYTVTANCINSDKQPVYLKGTVTLIR